MPPYASVPPLLQPAHIEGQDAVVVLREEVARVHLDMENCWRKYVADSGSPSGSRFSDAAALYAHAICVEDATVHVLLRQVPPLFADSEHHSAAFQAQPGSAAFSRYRRDVFAATDRYLAELPLEALRQQVDLSRVGLGKPTIGRVITRFVVLELARICSELSRYG